VAIERRSKEPMFDLSLLRERAFVGVLIAAVSLFLAAFAALMYTSIWLQSVLGMSPVQAGLVGLPLSAMAFVVSGGLGRYLHGGNPGRIIGGGLLAIGVGGLLGGVLVHGDAGWTALIPGYLAVGAGVGLATATLGSAAMSAVAPQRGGMATGAMNTAQQLGMAFGIAVLASIFTARAQDVLADRGVPGAATAAQAVAGGRTAPLPMQDAIHAAAVAGVQGTLAVSGVVGLLGGVLTMALIRPTGRTPSDIIDAELARESTGA
jgi:hypothetical protein